MSSGHSHWCTCSQVPAEKQLRLESDGEQFVKDKKNISHLLFQYVVSGMGTSDFEQKAANFSCDL